MRVIFGATGLILAWVGGAAAQEVEPSSVRGPYFAVGAQTGGGSDLCDADDCVGGYGALGRLGYRWNRVLSVEADLGIIDVRGEDSGSETFAHAAALGVATLPIGPVDLRTRLGGGVFSADGGSRLGFAGGSGIGFRPDERSAIRADLLVFVGGDTDDLEFDLGGLVQLAYERRF